MKKMISVALALMLVFALAVSAAAASYISPTGKDHYSITIATDLADGSLGTAQSDKNQVDADATGDDAEVTLTATETKGYFTLWVIDGDYETVSGDETTPVLTIIPKSDINATASFSAEKDYLVTTVSASGDGKASADPVKVKKNSGGTVTLTAVDGKDTFSEWKLEFKYDIVEGSLTSRTLTIRPYTDIRAVAVFKSSGSSSTPDDSTSKPNSSSTSPKTGDPLWIIIGLAVLALGAGTLAVKKIKE